jgi:F420-dependent oxidoreductase-like protein
MRDLKVGIQVSQKDSHQMLKGIVAAERAGIDAAWVGLRPNGPDPLPVFAAAAGLTERIVMGTAIIPIFPRHPLALAQAALAVESFAPGRLRLGVGTSAKPAVEQIYGMSFERPVAYLREYLEILSAMLTKGVVDHHGERLTAVAEFDEPVTIPVMVAALNAGSARLAGELTSGVIPWMCTPDYLSSVIGPALREGAESVGRPTPRMVAHAPIAVSEDVTAVRAAARRQLGHYPKIPFYVRMFERAGFAEAAAGELSDGMIDAIVGYGPSEAIESRLSQLAAAGADEVIVTPLLVEGDLDAFDRTLSVLGALSALQT